MRFYPVTIETTTENSGAIIYSGSIELDDHHGLNSYGESVAFVLSDLAEQLALMAEIYFDENQLFPEPKTAKDGEQLVKMPTLLELKTLLHNERIKRKLSKVELGRRAGISAVEMQRIFNPHHNTKLATLERLFLAVGLAPQVSLLSV